jgi:hypothetical protein
MLYIVSIQLLKIDFTAYINNVLLAFIVVSLVTPIFWLILSRTNRGLRVKNWVYRKSQTGTIHVQNNIRKYEMTLAWATLLLSLLILFIRFQAHIQYDLSSLNISQDDTQFPKIKGIIISWQLLLEGVHLLCEIVIPVSLVILSILKIVERLSDPMKIFFNSLSGVLEDLIKRAGKDGNTSEEKIKKTVVEFFSPLPEDFDIVEVDNEKKIQELHRIATKAWGNAKMSKASRISLYSSWHSKNGGVFSLIIEKSSGDPAGYMCVLPLYSGEHFSGTKQKDSIHWSEIVEGKRRPETKMYIYLESLFVDPRHQGNKKLAKQIYEELITKICQFMGKKETIIYADSQYRSLNRALSKLGFGPGRKIEKNSFTKYIPLYDGEEITATSHPDLYKRYYEDGKCGSKDIDIKVLFYSIEYIKVYKITRRIQLEATFDEMLHGRIAEFSKTENSEPIKEILGKNLLICFHTTYSDSTESGKDKTHFFSTATLNFSHLPNKNYIDCSLTTYTKRNHGKYFYYKGIAFFGEKFQEMIICLYPIRESENCKTWSDYDRTHDIYPIIIRGTFLPAVFNKSKFMPLNYSYFSFLSKTHLSKIALLSDAITLGIEDKAQSIPLMLKDTNSTNLNTAMKFLMRGNKVSISTINFGSTGSVEEWMDSKFSQKVGIEKNNKLLLLYYKRNDQGSPILSRAQVEFYNNGIAKLTRKYIIKMQGQEVPNVDTYYGEFNLRHKLRREDYIYLKLIQMNSDPSGELHQYYRELFITLFWPDSNNKGFDFTRGLITSDKDREEGIGKHSMSSNICLLCHINENWSTYFKISDPFNDFLYKKAEKEISNFLDTVIERTNLPFGGKIDHGSIDLIFGDDFCSYKEFFKP